ncbi:MAG: hypothetical protein LH660_06235 [Phormidesmis sp. CAN_BIN36]|nr:hypothetical protein [Phormidesmis sp. CAN_BIN36]
MSMTVDSVNDIFRQAHQGSVAAIIQVLNDKLADSGIRTRAIFANGILQLLCEAATQEQLEQTTLTDRVQKILEAIQPRSVRRVNINSRIVREQQLLWLEEINRDPDGQVLWSKEIVLTRKNPLKRLLTDWRNDRVESFDRPRTISPHLMREQHQFKKGIVGGLAVSAGLLLAGWGVYMWQEGRSSTALQPKSSNSIQSASAVKLDQDNFATAVRLAERASEIGRTAQTPDQWRNLADTWGKASTLMGTVPASDKRYAVALDRTALYRRYQESALQKIK